VVDAAVSIFAAPCPPSCVHANSVAATLASSRGDQCGDPSLSPAQHLNKFSESSSGRLGDSDEDEKEKIERESWRGGKGKADDCIVWW
jgi:hypothetical protein